MFTQPQSTATEFQAAVDHDRTGGGEACDLIVCSGDVLVDGSDSEDELAFAAEQFRRIKRDVLFVPRNHDIANSRPDVRGGKSVITAVRREAYIRHFGADFCNAYQAKGDLDRAIADSDQIIALDPKDGDAHSSRATAYLSRGDFRRAIADFGRGQVLLWLATIVLLAADRLAL